MKRPSALFWSIGVAAVMATASAGNRIELGKAGDTPQALSFENGLWFDGRKFRPATFYSIDGKLTSRKPASITRTIDLKGGYVVSPFAEGHNHNITSEWGLNSEAPRYFREGIFYLRVPSSIHPRTAGIRDRVNRPDSLDILFGSPALTSHGGHPEPLRRRLAASGVIPGLDPEKLDGTTHFRVDSVKELDEKWEAVLATKSDFVKTILGFSTESDRAAKRIGLAPEVYRHTVRRAHAAGLRVVTHIETAADFALAVDAGTDEIAHLPGYNTIYPLGAAAYILDEATARKAARHGTIVHTTCGFSRVYFPKEQEQTKPVQIHNLRLLHAAGVRLSVGSDVTALTASDEMAYLKSLSVFDNLTLLKLWSEVTPQTIFPGRKIGRLKDGHEASLLVLDCNPIETFECTARIRLRLKQGRLIELPGSGG